MRGNPGLSWCILTLRYKGMEPIVTSGWLTAAALTAAMAVASENTALEVTPSTPPAGAADATPIQVPDFGLLGLPFLANVNQFNCRTLHRAALVNRLTRRPPTSSPS